MQKEYSLNTNMGNKISITTFGNIDGKKGVIIFVHGFKGFKDWGFGPYLGSYFAKHGFLAVTFNFSHNGIGKNNYEFTELDKFAANTISLEVSELREVIDFCNSGIFGKLVKSNIGLLGHSRGGAVSLLAAKGNNSVSAVGLWSAISSFDRFTVKQKNEWELKGFTTVKNARTGQAMRINKTFWEDIQKNKEDSLCIKKAAEDLGKPLLIANGQLDLAVSPHEAELLYKWSDKSLTEFHIISKAGHTFNISHPFENSNREFERLLDATRLFFTKFL